MKSPLIAPVSTVAVFIVLAIAASSPADADETPNVTFRQSSTAVDAYDFVECIVPHPYDPQVIYLGCQYGLYPSSNAGETRRRTTNEMPHHHVRRVAIRTSQPDVMSATLWTKPGGTTWQGGVCKLVDVGERWQPCLEGLDQHAGKPGEASQRTFNCDRPVVHPENPDVGCDGWGERRVGRRGTALIP